MRYFSAILTALVLALSAASASAQKNIFAEPRPASSEPSARQLLPLPDQLALCNEDVQELKIENAKLKGAMEAAENRYVQFWPTDPLPYLAIMSFPIAWAVVNFFRIVGRTSPSKPKKKEDKEDKEDNSD